MSTAEFKKTMHEAKDLGCSHVHFTGGEPLLRCDIVELISYASKLGMQLRLQTNGMLLSNKMAEQLMNAGLDSIMISLDSDRSNEHDFMRADGTWSAAVEAINIARDVGMKVRVNSVLTKINWKRIHLTALFVRHLGIDSYSAFYFSPIGSGRQLREYWIEPREYLEFWQDLTKELTLDSELSDMNIVIEKGYSDWQEAYKIDNSDFSGCGGGCRSTYTKRDYLIVRCDGNVYPCIMGIDGESLGNLHNQALQDIHKNSLQWDKLIPSNDSFCAGCDHYTLCSEGCRYYPQQSFGHDIRCIKGYIVPLCPIMKYNTKNDKVGGSSDDVMV